MYWPLRNPQPDPLSSSAGIKLELPEYLQKVLDGLLAAAWWDGCFRGLVVGVAVGGFAVALLWCMSRRKGD